MLGRWRLVWQLPGAIVICGQEIVPHQPGTVNGHLIPTPRGAPAWSAVTKIHQDIWSGVHLTQAHYLVTVQPGRGGGHGGALTALWGGAYYAGMWRTVSRAEAYRSRAHPGLEGCPHATLHHSKATPLRASHGCAAGVSACCPPVPSTRAVFAQATDGPACTIPPMPDKPQQDPGSGYYAGKYS